MKRLLFAGVLLLGLLTSESRADFSIPQSLLLLGHRNWIVIADSAYPSQVSPGVETVYVGGDQLKEVKDVLDELAASKHVKPIIHMDAELKHLDDKLAPGVVAYRNGLMALLGSRKVKEEPHEDIIRKLDEAGKTFHVLILKTDAVLPYTSVFIELDCAYWSAEKEKQLREAMAK